MTPLEDELKRLFSDERLALRPAPYSTQRIVRRARRRRVVMTVAASAGGVGLAAAAVMGSFAVADVVTAPGVPAIVEPAAPDPTTPEVTSDPTTPPPTTPPPTTAPPETPPATSPVPVEETPEPETDGPTGSSAPEVDAAPPAVPQAPDPNRFEALPVVDPGSGFGGVALGMTIAELQQVSGVTVTEFTEAQGRTDYCYGRYTSGSVSGYVSVRGAWGELPQDPDELYAEYRVTTIVPEVPLRTPEGIAVGSTVDEVAAAYPDLDSRSDQWWSPPRTYHEWARSWRFDISGGAVTRWWLDGLQNCENP